MSSRLNPRDYDLGELRDAVRGTARRRDADRPDGPFDDDLDRDAPGSDEPGLTRAALGRYAEPGRGPARSSDGGYEPVGTRSGGAVGSTSRNGSDSSGDRPDDAGTAGAPGVDTHAPVGSGSQDLSTNGGTGRRRESSETGPSTDGRASRGSKRSAKNDGTRAGIDDTPSDRNGSSTVAPTDAGPRQGTAVRSSPSVGSLGPTVRENDRVEQLAHLSRDGVERPYLDGVPDGYASQPVIFEWLERLVETSGRGDTHEALAYYESIGWLSAESRERLESFLEGLSAAEPPDPRPLDVDDHRESLRYVAILAHRVDR